MADRDQVVAEFRSVTGADEERARFYLVSSEWDLNVALSSFYDNDLEIPSTASEEPPTLLSPASGQSTRQPPSAGRYATISSLHKEESSSESEEEGQAFYAGGSERSGQQIIGPSKKKVNPDKITKAIFDAAKRQGAQEIEEEEDTERRDRSRAFQGAGFRLGSDVLPSQQVSAPLAQGNLGRQETVRVILKFWSNGFSIDDGPLRSFDDPSNKVFLSAVERGEIPDELHRLAQGGEVHVNVEDHRGEEFKQPKPKMKAFAGAGHLLGSPTPNIVSSPPSQSAASSSSNPPPPSNVHLDESKPITTLQIRLADGTRLVVKFNHTSTVGDVRELVRNARPSTGDNFILMTTFPNKELTDQSQTLVEANLLNAVIVQRRK